MKLKKKKAVRQAFWDAHPQFKNEYHKKKKQNDYSAKIRMAFVNFIDFSEKNNVISEKMASNIIL
ncbi:MAG: hypothetical protein ACPG5B_06880 [Chitinophagales bacterium]